MTPPPFAALKWPLSVVLGAVLLAGGGVLWSWGTSRAATTAYADAERVHAAAQARLGRSRLQQQLIATHLADYETLVARGFVGTENRLGWIEAAQLASREAGLAGLEYRLDPRTDAPPAQAQTQGLPLKQSAMTLTVPLLVETDLVRFLAALQRRAPGIHRVRACSLSRLDNAPFAAVNQPRLQAECELLWFTVDFPQGEAT